MIKASRVKRFDEIDTDSDFDFQDEGPARKTVPTLSFKTATVTEDTDSIAFESEHERSQHSEKALLSSPHGQQGPSSARASALDAVGPPPRDTESEKGPAALPSDIVAEIPQVEPPAATIDPSIAAESPSPPVASKQLKRRKVTDPTTCAAEPPNPPTPLPARPKPEATNAGKAAPLEPLPSPPGHLSHHNPSFPGDEHADMADDESDEFVQQVLPLHDHWATGRDSPGATSSRLPRTEIDDGDVVDEVLLRAQLRMEEWRRTKMTSQQNSRQLTPRRRDSATLATPMRDSAPRPVPGKSSTFTDVDARLRRLQLENGRLRDEVAFLGRENQKRRGVHSAGESSEAVRLQLTVDMLRKELESKQIGFQRALEIAHAQVREVQGHVEEVTEQCESYQSSSDQYKHLYTEKQRELEKVKIQLQSLLSSVSEMEQHQRSLEAEHADNVASERVKAERAASVAEEVKRQRDALQLLNTQLQSEISVAVEAKQKALEEAAAIREDARRNRVNYEQRIQQLQQDAAQLSKNMGEKERLLTGQLREAQQAYVVLQTQVKAQTEETLRGAGRHQRAMEVLREDHLRALEHEKQRRALLEEKVQQLEEENNAAQSRHTALLSADAEARIQKLRGELRDEQVAREAAEAAVVRLSAEVENLHESTQYYQQESQRVSSHLTRSEEIREKKERQCEMLTHTLEDLMAQEETHVREIERLQEAISTAQWGSGVASPNGAADTEGFLNDIRQLSDENDRLTGECSRIAQERDALVEENGRIAEQLLKWKQEMQHYVRSHVHTSSPQRRTP